MGFEEVYVSKHEKVRIVKLLQVSEESKRWGADPKNRLCDAPGSWYCPGQYPPAIKDLFDKQAAARNPEAAAYQTMFEERVKQQMAGMAKPNGKGIPDGSYLGSCQGCNIDGKLLTCTH